MPVHIIMYSVISMIPLRKRLLHRADHRQDLLISLAFWSGDEAVEKPALLNKRI